METEDQEAKGWVTLRAFGLGVFLSGLFAWITVLRDNADPGADPNLYLAANWMAVLPHVMLLFSGLIINPILARIKLIRLFSREELLLIFVMCAVSSGIATFGLSGKLVPTVSALSNKAWNTEQSQWDITAIPFLNEHYFIVGEGTQDAARRLREAHQRYENARDTYQVARDLLLGQERLTELEAELRDIAAITDPVVRASREYGLRWPISQAELLIANTRERWTTLGSNIDPKTVVGTFPPKIQALKAERDRLRLALADLNQGAFTAVEEVRKGFTSEKRALPGFFYSRGEGFVSYRSRLSRLRNGLKSQGLLNQAEAELSRAIAQGTDMPADLPDRVRAAAKALDPVAELPALKAVQDELAAKLRDVEQQLAQRNNQARMLRHLRRYADSSRVDMISDQIVKADKDVENLDKRILDLREREEKEIKPVLEMCARVNQTQLALEQLAKGASQVSPAAYPGLLAELGTVKASYRSFDASGRRFCLGDVPWGLWLRPIVNWLALVFLGYMVLLTFNTLIFRQWAHHEKLIYPLAEVTLVIAGGMQNEGKEKPLFRSGLFWGGVSLSAGILGWNYLASNNIIANVSPIVLEFMWGKYVYGSIFSGLSATWFCIIFMVIGITFLVPANISFSLWFFELLYMGLIMALVALGYGTDRQSLGGAPGRFGLGAGAMLVFGIAILWTCRQYLLCVFKPAILKGLPDDEAKELRIASAVFTASSLAMMMLLTVGLGANFLFVALFFLLVLVMLVALVRAVAEGGVLGMECVAGASGLTGMFLGMVHAPIVPATVAPVGIFNGLLFGGTKAFIAPMMANALKIREHFRMRRLHFHGALWAGILAATAVSIVALIVISYDRGADNLHGWLNSADPKWAIEGVKAGSTTTWNVLEESKRNWLAAGMILMGGLLFLRRRVFGIPHPIGLLMLANTSMFGLWISILIGWACKSLVSKYASHEHYVSIRRFFIGLILGHLLALLMGWDALEFHWG